LFVLTRRQPALDLGDLKPGAIVVADAAARAIHAHIARERFEGSGEVLACEAGLIDGRSLPIRSAAALGTGDHVFASVAEGLLVHLIPRLKPSRGDVAPADVTRVGQFAENFGLRLPPLSCGGKPHAPAALEAFAHRFGEQ
jgi:hypothetical protein